VYIGPIQRINQHTSTRNLVVDRTPNLPHEIHIKGFVVKDTFIAFDTTLKPNSLIASRLDNLTKCGNIHPQVIVLLGF